MSNGKVLSDAQREAAAERSYLWRLQQIASDPVAYRLAERARVAARRARVNEGESLPTRPNAVGIPRRRRPPMAITQEEASVTIAPMVSLAPDPVLTAIPSLMERLRAKRQSLRRNIYA